MYKLQIEHVVPFCVDARHDPENLTVLCAVHNQYMADVRLGREFMAMKRGEVVN